MISRFILAFFLIFTFNSVSFAQFAINKTNPFSNKVLLTLSGGLSYSETDYSNPILGFNGSGAVKYFFPTEKNLFLGVKLEAGYDNISGDFNSTNKFETDLLSFGPLLNINYKFNNKIYPYAGLGIKYLWYANFTSIDFVTELGIRFLISNYFAINGNLSLNFLTEDNLDNLAIPNSSNDFFASFSIGISYALDLAGTNKVDTDGDGISDNDEIDIYFTDPNKIDTDGDGLSDNDEINRYFTNPNKVDTDGDGLSDNEEINSYFTDAQKSDTDSDGLGDGDEINKYFTDPNNSDTDGDGLLDGEDNCPNLPEDFDGFEDEDGCPDVDNDNDGILDVDDKCPGEAETFNNYQDTDGCPDEIPETDIIKEIKSEEKTESKRIETKNKVRVAIPNEFLLDGENAFYSNTSNIQKNYYKKLNEIAEMMKSNPNFKWRIEGHLDNSGSPTERKALSTSMASSVMDYLISRGVSSRSLQVIGLSDEYPLAPNSTIQGRLKNRRVEIKRIR